MNERPTARTIMIPIALVEFIPSYQATGPEEVKAAVKIKLEANVED